MRVFKKDLTEDKSATKQTLLEDIVMTKQLNFDRNGFTSFNKMIDLYFNSEISKRYIEKIRIITFDFDSTIHVDNLRKFWNLLTKNKPLPNLITRDWIDLGFQGENPATDFRGAGNQFHE